MFGFGKTTEKPELPKEYVWELEIEGQDHTYSCIVTEDMVTTFEDGVEKKHLKVMNHECKQGVLQIDTVTSLFGEPMSFQLERYIPYIKLESGWTSSDTTKKDRLEATVATYRNNAKWEIIVGTLGILVAVIKWLISGTMGDWYMASIFGIFFVFAGFSTKTRLKQELAALKEEEERNDLEELPDVPTVRRENAKAETTEE